MIGLKRGTVKLAEYDRAWSKLFDQEKNRIINKIEENNISDIQHIGSTAIPNIKSKPIIDMLAGVARLKDANELIKPLDELGYKFYRKSNQEIFFAKGPDKKRTHYLHIVRHRGIKWKNDLFFRDYLLIHPNEAKKYEILKVKLAKENKNTRSVYTKKKNTFIKEILGLVKK